MCSLKMCMDTHRMPLSDFTEEPAVRLCSQGAMTPKEHGRLHKSVIVSWEVGGREAGRGVVWAALPSQLMLQGRIQPQLDMEIYSQVILQCLLHSPRVLPCAKPPNTCLLQAEGPSGPISWVMKPTTCSAWTEAGLTALYWWASFLVGRFREKRQLKLENLTVLVSSPTTTLEVVWLEWRV